MSEGLTVRRLSEEPGPWWDDLCRRAGSPWNSLGPARLQGEFGVEPIFFAAFQGEHPVGGLVAYIAGSRRVRAIDPILARTALVPDEPVAVADQPLAVPALIQALERELDDLNVVSAVFRVELPRLLAAKNLEARAWEVAVRGVAILDLPEREEEVDALLHKTARKQVRKAERLGVIVEAAADATRLLPLLDLSFRRAGLEARDHDYVRKTLQMLGGEVLVARHGDRDIAALLWAPFGETALNIYHGRDDGETEGASNLLHREMFLRAFRRGVRLIHTGDAALEGETDPRLLGITRFKEKMGFEVRPAFQGRKVLRPAAAAARDLSVRAWGAFRGWWEG